MSSKGHHSCEACAVRHKALCGALSNDELTKLNAIARNRKLEAGQTILSDHEAPSYFANIVDGVVKLTKTLADGRQQIVGLQFASDFLGRPFRDQSPYFAEAATDVELCTFPKAQFEGLVREFPGLEHRLFEHTLDELDAAQEWMVLLGRKTAEERVASLLLMVAKRMSAVGCQSASGLNFVEFDLPLTRTDIADHLGLTIETVSRQFTRLRSMGLIKLKGTRTVIVPDISALEDIAEVDPE
jgi:CRP/FNR family transcriptional regulator